MKPYSKVLANWLTNDFQGMLNKRKLTIKNCGIEPEDFGFLVQMVRCGLIEKERLREILEKKLDGKIEG